MNIEKIDREMRHSDQMFEGSQAPKVTICVQYLKTHKHVAQKHFCRQIILKHTNMFPDKQSRDPTKYVHIEYIHICFWLFSKTVMMIMWVEMMMRITLVMTLRMTIIIGREVAVSLILDYGSPRRTHYPLST